MHSIGSHKMGRGRGQWPARGQLRGQTSRERTGSDSEGTRRENGEIHRNTATEQRDMREY